MKKLVLLAAISLLAGCAADPSASTGNTPRRERAEAPTGSNLPRRGGNDGSTTTYDRESVERAQAGSYGGIPRVPNN